MNSWTIGKKLRTGFCVMLALTLGLSYYSLSAIERLGSALVADRARTMDLVGTVRLSLREMVELAKFGQITYVVSHIKRLDGEAAHGAKSDGVNCSACHTMDRFDVGGQEFNQLASQVHQQVAQLREPISDPEGRKLLQTIDAGVTQWASLYAEFLRDTGQNNYDDAHSVIRDRMYPILEQVDKAAKQLTEQQRDYLSAAGIDATRTISRSRWVAFLLLALSLTIGVLVLLMILSICRVLRGVAADLNEHSVKVGQTAAQITSASQSLAQGTSEQAASLEETSASAEEITSMTHRNADNSRSAADLTAVAADLVTVANRNLEQMVGSMQEINSSSGKISKIIKVIDEIAFQTNILALNAAVEAARAGESGAGFAVVAGEVRNLAQRCAQAAQDTAVLIEDSISKSRDGKTKLDLVADGFHHITSNVSQIKILVDAVNMGSVEQTRGMDQIAKAVGQMEQVTQSAAAHAEESAAAGDELNNQARSTQEIVEKLSSLVGSQ